jgi:hypothetical protein
MLHTGKQRKLLGVFKLRFTVPFVKWSLASFTRPIQLAEIAELLPWSVSIDKMHHIHWNLNKMKNRKAESMEEPEGRVTHKIIPTGGEIGEQGRQRMKEFYKERESDIDINANEMEKEYGKEGGITNSKRYRNE